MWITVSQEILTETSVQGLLQRIADAALLLTGARLCLAGHGPEAERFQAGVVAQAPDSPARVAAEIFTPETGAGYLALVPPGFRNEVAARIALTAGLYRPVRHAARVRCPVLVQVCERDSVAPASAAGQAIARLGSHAEAKRYPIGHFEPYFGAHFERSVSDQLAFLRRHLRP